MAIIYPKIQSLLQIFGVFQMLAEWFIMSHYTYLPRSMMHDPDVFHTPTEFRPERFLSDEITTAAVGVAFGFGRR
jgi:hypothetical protein